MSETKEKKILSVVSKAVTVLLVLVVVLCLYVVIQLLNNGYVNMGGFILFRVVTGSMEPTIPVGTLLVSQQVDIGSVELQDIVCFHTKDTQIYGSVVTHRVVDLLTGADGSILLETKGDANPVADGYLVGQENFIGKVVWYSGGDNVLATAFSFLTDKVGFLGCIVFPSLILATFVLRSCVSNIQEELRRAREEMEHPEEVTSDNLLSSMTEQEYEDMVSKLRQELMQELTRQQEGEDHAEILEEQDSKSDTTE